MSGLFNDDTLSLYLKLKEAMKQYLSDAFGGSLNAEVPNYPQMIANQAKAQQNTLRDAWGDPNKMADATLGMMNGAMGSFLPFGITAWHGSPHKFDKFDLSKIGTGEGAQAYGHGSYLAETPDVAQTYKQSADWRQKTMDQMRYLVDGKEVTPKGVDDGLLYHYRMSAPDLFEERIQHLERQKAGSIDQARYYAEQSKLGDDPERYARMAKRAQETAKKFDEELQIAAKLKNQKVEAATGFLYKTDIPDEAVARFLDWDKPLSEQAHVMDLINKQEAQRTQSVLDRRLQTLANVGEDAPNAPILKKQIEILREEVANPQSGVGSMTGGEYYNYLRRRDIQPSEQANMFRNAGIPGIRYLDGGSRGAGTGTSNFVVFDPELIRILERNGVATGAKPWQPGEWEGLFKK